MFKLGLMHLEHGVKVAGFYRCEAEQRVKGKV